MPAKNSAELTINDQIDLLLKLQEINQNLDSLVEEIDILKDEAAQEEKKYLTKKVQYDKHYPYLEKCDEEYKSIRIELDDIKQKIEELEEKKKKIKTIKEFKAINKEIATLNKKNAIRENDYMTKGEELEFKTSKIDKIKESLDEIKEVINKKKEDLDTLITERKDSINKLTKEKEKVEAKLPVAMVTTFTRIYKNKFRTAVVPVENQVCHGCYMQIPFQTEIDVKKSSELAFCPSCSRILFYDGEANVLSA
jgi:predicted  nucleic acid-binding Zn-ribbon protein